MLIHSDPNNMNLIVYHLIIVRYSMKTLHWYFSWATASHFYNMTGRGEKLQQLHCYHPFSDSLDIYLTKNHHENYSPKMVPIAKIWGSGSWTTRTYKNDKLKFHILSHSVIYCICVPGKPGICFYYYCAVYAECKYLDTFWLAHHTHLFVQNTISLSSLCKLIWGQWTYKMPVRYILSSVWARLSIFSLLFIIQYVGLYVFSLLISLVMIERIYILCLIINIKSVVWTINHCLGLGHELMVSAVCFSIFLPKHVLWYYQSCQPNKISFRNNHPIFQGHQHEMLIRNNSFQRLHRFLCRTLYRIIMKSGLFFRDKSSILRTCPERKRYMAALYNCNMKIHTFAV